MQSRSAIAWLLRPVEISRSTSSSRAVRPPVSRGAAGERPRAPRVDRVRPAPPTSRNARRAASARRSRDRARRRRRRAAEPFHDRCQIDARARGFNGAPLSSKRSTASSSSRRAASRSPVAGATSPAARLAEASSGGVPALAAMLCSSSSAARARSRSRSRSRLVSRADEQLERRGALGAVRHRQTPQMPLDEIRRRPA